MLNRFCLLPLFLVLSLSHHALAMPHEESIKSLTSLITVERDSSLLVQETIQVVALRKIIKRGIFRDFPTIYKNTLGVRQRVGFKVLEVLHNGKRANFVLEGITGQWGNSGTRIRVGDANKFLDTGVHTYQIRYRTTEQLLIPDESTDQLYWNVTGNGWDFPIQSASATVIFPFDVNGNKVTLEGWTGKSGEKGQDFFQKLMPPNKAFFQTTEQLGNNEGFTIRVSWPKGFVHRPDASELQSRWIRDNGHILVGVGGLLVVLVYFGVVWSQVGVDPPKGTIIPLFDSPDGLSPADIRFIHRMDFDEKCLTAAILSMAVKGFLKIHDADGIFTLQKVSDDLTKLTNDEKEVAKIIFSLSSSVVLKQSNQVVRNTLKHLKQALELEHFKVHFQKNSKFLIPGALLSLTTLAASVGSLPAEHKAMSLFMSAWLSIWTFAIVALATKVQLAWRSVIYSKAKNGTELASAAFITLFSLPFFAGELFGIYVFVHSGSLALLLVVLLLGVANYSFYRLLKQPTLHGRRIMDKIEGFKLYLSVAEKDRLDYMAPKENSTEHWEMFLPYALALNVESQWTEKFSEVLKNASALPSATAGHRTWYHGHHSNLSNFGNSFGSTFSSAISSASTAPSSSGNRGGGGSSGGGGGGGGGGGW